MRAAVADLPAERRSVASRTIVRHLQRAGKLDLAEKIAVFAGLPDEPDLSALWRRGADPHGLPRFAFPRVEGPELAFYTVGALGDFVLSRWGIAEPDVGRAVSVPPEKIDVVLVPGVAFSRAGQRLGRGKGFYDRLLPRLRPDVWRVGVAFGIQMVDSLPTERHDQSLTHLVTEDGWLTF